MIYFLSLFDTQLAASLENAREAHNSGEHFERSSPYSQKSTRKWRAATSLVTHHPRLIIHEFDLKEFAKRERKSIQEVDAAHPYVYVGDTYGEHAVQLHIFDLAVEIEVDAPRDGEDTEGVSAALYGYLERLHMEGYNCIYDPQRDRLLNLDTDRESLAQEYRKALDANNDAASKQPSGKQKSSEPIEAASKPWWKFW